MLRKSLLLGLTAAVALAGAAVAQDPLKIVYIGKNTGNPYFDSITGGFEDACESLGCEFEFVAPWLHFDKEEQVSHGCSRRHPGRRRCLNPPKPSH